MTKRGEIWIASLEPKKGAEFGKQRPVLIIQTDLLNEIGHPTVVVAPISSQMQTENILRFRIENAAFHKGIGYVLIDQIKTIDATLRLKKKIGRLTAAEMSTLGKLFTHVLDLECA